jgi:hypothetical protein
VSSDAPADRALQRHVLLGLFLLWFCAACTSVPRGRSAVDSVKLKGNASLDSDELKEKLATAVSPRFLGLFSGVVYD